MPPEWMPDLITFGMHGGDWTRYLDAIYAEFRSCFLERTLEFKGKRVGLKRHPMIADREATFWHFISEGKVEEDRLPNLRRCERIAWPLAMMQNCDSEHVDMWTERVGSEDRVHLWCERAEYLFVLADRGDFVLPWTGYPVEYRSQQQKLHKRRDRALGNG